MGDGHVVCYEPPDLVKEAQDFSSTDDDNASLEESQQPSSVDDNANTERSLLSRRAGTELEVGSVKCYKNMKINGCCGVYDNGNDCTKSYSGKASSAESCYKDHGGHKSTHGACEWAKGKCDCWSKCLAAWHPKANKDGHVVCYEPPDVVKEAQDYSSTDDDNASLEESQQPSSVDTMPIQNAACCLEELGQS